MSAIASTFSLHVEQINGFEFRVKFDKEQFAPLLLDEPPPLGHDTAPNAARVLAAAIGNCLSASLLFCLQKAKVPAPSVSADVQVEIVRNEARRLRIGKVDVTLHTSLPAEDPSLSSCLSTFEDFCVVTQSVRQGIDVAVKVVGRQ
ncbi:MAG TPA: OsmC family protein [Polyangiaceae bacterium]|nr:OsmC family protein [Polyangiaceae bacterium]